MFEEKIWRTKVLVIDYPSSKKEELEEMLNPLAPNIDTMYGEIWEPYDGLKSGAVYTILDNLDSVKATQSIKEELLELISDWEHYGDDDPDCDVQLSRGYKNASEEIKKLVEKM